MQVPLKITTDSVRLSKREEQLIRRQITMLERFYSRLTRCEVVIDGPGGRHQRGGPFEARLHLGVPGDELTVDRQSGEDPTSALRQAFAAGRRQLQDWVRVKQGSVKRHRPARTALVARLFSEDGYGFLETADGREIYFHAHAVLDPGGFAALEIGTEVRFHEEQGDEGPQASSLTLTRRPAMSESPEPTTV